MISETIKKGVKTPLNHLLIICPRHKWRGYMRLGREIRKNFLLLKWSAYKLIKV
jgi:hypothetical protein